MTIQYRPSSHPTDEAAQAAMPESEALRIGGLGASSTEAAPTLNLPNPSPDANYDYIHHILIGSPQGVTDAINRLHLGHRIERHRWTPLIAVREAGIHITPAQGQVISYLIQQRPKD
ncbi:MAG: hypothetical protein ACFB4J_09545 [Elainellaceae cyanobacterium]